MSIAEKLMAVAENIPKVYEAGKNGFGYKKTFVGESLQIEDVVPIRHTVLAGVTSKNLFEEANKNIRIDPTKNYYLSSGEGTASRISFQIYDIDENKVTDSGVTIANFYYNGKMWMLAADRNSLKLPIRFSGANREKIAYIKFSSSSFPDIQFEQNSKVTSYTPYVSDFGKTKLIVNSTDIYSADETGAVEPMISAPTMNIISNTPGVIVAAECFVNADAYVKKLETTILNLGGTI